MAEIEEEVQLEITVDNLQFLTGNTGKDRIMLENLVLSKEDASTIAWLSNHSGGTKLILELKKK